MRRAAREDGRRAERRSVREVAGEGSGEGAVTVTETEDSWGGFRENEEEG
jgi:hypothetical protein